MERNLGIGKEPSPWMVEEKRSRVSAWQPFGVRLWQRSLPDPKDAGEPACFIVKMRKSGELHLTLLSVSQLFPKWPLRSFYYFVLSLKMSA